MAVNAKHDLRSGTAWVAGAKTKDPTITLVNCTGDRRRDQESDNQSASSHCTCTGGFVNCAEGGRKDQQFENQFGQLHGWQAQRTRMQLDPTITLVNCTGGRQSRDPTINSLNSGGRRGHPHFENQPGKLPGGRRSAETKDLTISLVNCTGGRRRVQGSDNQSLELHGWQAQTPSVSKSTWSTARWQAQKQQF